MQFRWSNHPIIIKKQRNFNSPLLPSIQPYNIYIETEVRAMCNTPSFTMKRSSQQQPSSFPTLGSSGTSCLNLAGLSLSDSNGPASCSTSKGHPHWQSNLSQTSLASTCATVSSTSSSSMYTAPSCGGGGGGLVRRPGWGSIDTRRAYGNLSALADPDQHSAEQQNRSAHHHHQNHNQYQNAQWDTTRSGGGGADDWGYFVDTPCRWS